MDSFFQRKNVKIIFTMIEVIPVCVLIASLKADAYRWVPSVTHRKIKKTQKRRAPWSEISWSSWEHVILCAVPADSVVLTGGRVDNIFPGRINRVDAALEKQSTNQIMCQAALALPNSGNAKKHRINMMCNPAWYYLALIFHCQHFN